MTSDDLKELKLKEDKKHKCFYVDKLSLHTVVNYPRVKNLIEVGMRQFHVMQLEARVGRVFRNEDFFLLKNRTSLDRQAYLKTQRCHTRNVRAIDQNQPENTPLLLSRFGG